jgi:hypothetical protein
MSQRKVGEALGSALEREGVQPVLVGTMRDPARRDDRGGILRLRRTRPAARGDRGEPSHSRRRLAAGGQPATHARLTTRRVLRRPTRRDGVARDNGLIGGLKQKLLAAQRNGLTEVFVPLRNEADLDDVPTEVLEALTVHVVGDVLDVVRHALVNETATSVAA